MRIGISLSAFIATALSACATAATPIPASAYPATLNDVNNDALRETIRLYIRDALGPDYTVDIDQLASRSVLIARDNGRTQVKGVRIPVPERTFRLVVSDRVDGVRCWLKADADMPEVKALALPETARCRPILDAP